MMIWTFEKVNLVLFIKKEPDQTRNYFFYGQEAFSRVVDGFCSSKC